MFSYFDRAGDFIKGQRGKWGFAYALFLGLLSALSMPPYPFIPFFFFAIVFALLLLSTATRGRQAFWMGIAFGIGHFGFGLYWVGYSFFAQSEIPGWLAPIAVALMVLYLSLYPGLVFFLTRKLWHTDWVRRTFAFAGLYVFAEYLRGNEPFFTGFPWNPASLIWWPSDSVLQTMSIWGSAGLGLVTLISAGFMAPLFDRAVGRRARLILPAIGLTIIAGMYGFGWTRLAEHPAEFRDDVAIRLVQANIPQTQKWDPAFVRRNLDKYLEMSRGPDLGQDVQGVVVWPETAVPYDVENNLTRDFIMARFGNVVLLTGAARQIDQPEPELNNSLYALGPGGEYLGRYDKHHLVPFGEYLPERRLLGFLGLGPLVGGTSNFDRGDGPATMRVDGLPPFSPLICYEVIFPDEVIVRDDRPDWLLNITNDAWFGISPGPYQHFQMARARAIEEGLPLVRVAGTGISAVVDPYGRVLSRIELGTEGTIDVFLPRPIAPTLYSGKGKIWGIWLVLGAAFVLLVIGAGAGLTARGKREEN